MTDLLANLAAAGAVEARGGFTLDPDKAREKLRQYQLAEPQRYVLLLVEAAIASGATRLDFEIDADDLHLRFDGAQFDQTQLADLYGSLFASIREVDPLARARLRGLQQLAFAINSAMALNPRFARITSVDRDGRGTLLELRPDQPDRVEALAVAGHDPSAPGNWVHVKDRFRPGLVVEFFRNLRGNLIETALVREHCRWSRTPIFVNGAQVSGPISFDGEPWTDLDVLDPSLDQALVIGRAALGVRGPAPVFPPGLPGRLVEPYAILLANGVMVERVALELGVPGFAAIVDSSRFGKDVSQTKLLRDEGYAAVMAMIAAAQARAVARLAERCLAGQAPAWAEATLLDWLQRAEVPSLRRAIAEDEIFGLVADVPLWPVVGGAKLPTRALIDLDVVLYTRESFDLLPSGVPFVIDLHVDEQVALDELLTRLFHDRRRDYTAELRRELERQRRRLEFLRRVQPAELDEALPVFTSLRGEGIRGELGIDPLGARDSWVRLVHEGCLLREVHVDHPLAGLRVVVAAELTPNVDHDAPIPDAKLAAALIAVLRGLLDALTQLAAHGKVTYEHAEYCALVLGYLGQTRRADYAVEFFTQFGFNRSLARRELDRLVGPDHAALRPSLGLSERGTEPHPLATLPLIPRVMDRPASLAELAARRAAGAPIRYLEPSQAPFPPLDVEVVVVDPRERELLTALFGKGALTSYAGELAQLRRRDAFMQRPVARPELPPTTLVRVPIRSGSVRGELGLTELAPHLGPSELTGGPAPVTVLYQGRELCSLTVELPLPGLVAWVDGDAFEVTPVFDGLLDPLRLRAPLLEALVELVARQIGEARREPERLRRGQWRWLLMIPNLVFGRGRLGSAFIRLCAARGRAQALLDLDALLALLERFPEADLDRALGRAEGVGELPLAAAVQAQLRAPSRRLTELDRQALATRRALLASLSELLVLPSVRRFQGPPATATTARTLSLAEIHAQVGAGEPLAWVGDSFSLEALPRAALLVAALDAVEQRLLANQLGIEALEHVEAWLQGRASFERRTQIREVRVPRGAVLTAVSMSGTGWRGELGLPRESPRHVQRSKIRVFVEQREVTIVDLPADPVPVVGALAFDQLALTERFDDLTAEARGQVRSIVRARSDELIVDLVAQFPSLQGDEQTRAAELVRHLLGHWPPGSGGYAARAKERPKLFAALAALPVFPGLRQRWSAAELANVRERHGQLDAVRYRRAAELPDRPILLLDSDEVAGIVELLFGPTRDLYAELEREAEIAARKAAAPALPSEPPADALASLAIAGERLTGWLWIRRGHEQVLFGADGHAVERRDVSAPCPCGGAITGPGLSVASDWSRVILSRSQDRLLERSAVALWSRLADDYRERSEAQTPRTQADRARLVAIRDALRARFLRLHEDHGRAYLDGSRDGSRGRARKRGNQHEQLYERLRALPLLELGDGHWISADVAARERPIELADLGLWTGPSAEELAHQRELERREAAREREQLAAQRAAERERQAAEQRQREAERRQREAQEAREREARAEHERTARAERERRARADAQPAKVAQTPADLLLAAVREQLRLVRAGNHGLASNHLIDTLTLGEPDRRGPLFRQLDDRSQLNPAHPLVEAAVAGYLDDPGLVTLLASAAYSFLNLVHAEIEDHDEAEFLRLHAAFAGTVVAGRR